MGSVTWTPKKKMEPGGPRAIELAKAKAGRSATTKRSHISPHPRNTMTPKHPHELSPLLAAGLQAGGQPPNLTEQE